MRIALVDYGAGNLHSAQKALERALGLAGQSGVVTVGADPEVVRRADAVVLPGDGAFADCRNALMAVGGLAEALEEAALVRGRPFFGICVGMQLLASLGEEHGTTHGLGWVPGRVVRLAPHDPRLKVPHMGWNTLDPVSAHPLVRGLPLSANGLHAYFLHSFHMIPDRRDDLVATADYGEPVSAIVARGNVFGTQFHPEKSQALGLALLTNFVRWRP